MLVFVLAANSATPYASGGSSRTDRSWIKCGFILSCSKNTLRLLRTPAKYPGRKRRSIDGDLGLIRSGKTLTAIDRYIALANDALRARSESDHETAVDLNLTLGRLCSEVFERLRARKNDGRVELPSNPVPYEAWIGVNGGVQLRLTESQLQYRDFLTVLSKLDARRIGVCPRCKEFFYGRRNQTYCGDAHRISHWKEANPLEVKSYEEKRQTVRKEEHEAKRALREKEEVSRIPDEIPSISKRPARLPGSKKFR
jgi:hypothetical protein